MVGAENNDSWQLVPISGSPGTSTGSVEFRVCNLSAITLKIYSESEIASTSYTEIFVDGVLDESVAVPNGSTEAVITLIFGLNECEKTIKVVGRTSRTEDTIHGGTFGLTDKITFDVIGVTNNP